MIVPADSGFGRLKGCCSCQCAFKIGRTPFFFACLQAIQDVKIARKQAPTLKPG